MSIQRINKWIEHSWFFNRHNYPSRTFYISLTISIIATIITSIFTWYDVYYTHKAIELIPLTQKLYMQWGIWFWIPRLIYVGTIYFGIPVNYWLFQWTTGYKEWFRNGINNFLMINFPLVFILDSLNDVLVGLIIMGYIH